MRRNRIKRIRIIRMTAALVMTVCMLGDLTGCGGTGSPVEQDITRVFTEENEAAKAGLKPEQDNTNLIGTITMAGSTSMEQFANALSESFMIKYPGVTVTVEFTGSSTGIQSVLSGSVDIGISSRNLTEAEKSSGAAENIVAIDGIAMIADAANTVTSLTKEQVVGIYTGVIRNWSEVGGDDEPIVVVGREAGSGTRETFEELLEIKNLCAYANELNSVGAVKARVVSTPGAVGYVSFDVLDDTVQTLSLDGTGPTQENIRSGSYQLCRPFVMATREEVSVQSEAVREMFAYLKSEEGRKLIKATGLVIPD